MRLNFLKQKYFDFMLIQNQSLDYLRIAKEKGDIKIVKSAKVEIDLYQEGILKLNNLEPALASIIQKYKIKEVGIILNLPSILFQKVNIMKVADINKAIFNYLKTTFPLPIEDYAWYYKEEGFRPIGTSTTFSIFLVDNNLINRILAITEKYNLIPLFITPISELIYQYLINKVLIEFKEEYLIFVLVESNIVTLMIKNFAIEKMIIEDYNLQKIHFSSVILSIYNFLKRELKETTKILFFLGDQTAELQEIKKPTTFVKIDPQRIITEGCYLALNNIFESKPIVDFLPFKNYYAYFINRLPNITIFLSVYTLFLAFIFSGIFLGLYYKLDQEKADLNQQIQKLTYLSPNEENLNKLFKISESLKPEIFTKASQIKDIIQRNDFQDLSYQNGNLIFSLKINKNDLNPVKNEISQKFPKARILEEIDLGTEINLKFGF